MTTVKGYQLLNCGKAQARNRNKRPIEPVKAKATKALTPAIFTLECDLVFFKAV